MGAGRAASRESAFPLKPSQIHHRGIDDRPGLLTGQVDARLLDTVHAVELLLDMPHARGAGHPSIGNMVSVTGGRVASMVADGVGVGSAANSRTP